jgi:hypothetical protein
MAEATGKEQPPEGKDWADNSVLLSDGKERLYFHCDRGNVCTGYLQGESSYEDKDGRMVEYFVFHTDRPCLVVTSDNKEPHEAPAGSMVHVNKRAQLESLHRYIGTDEVVWAGLEPTAKKAIGGGKTVWNFKLAVRTTGKRRPKILLGQGRARVVSSDGADGDIPF